MTHLTGIRTLIVEESRLAEPLFKATLILDALLIATAGVKTGKFDGEILETGQLRTSVIGASALECKQFPLWVRMPAFSATVALVHGVKVKRMEVEFSPANTITHNDIDVADISIVILSVITPLYVDFFEKHRHWLKATYGGDAYAWPMLFNFGRVIRNFISHHAGHVHFDNANAAPVTWHHLSYSPADEGKQVIGTDLALGDMIVLLFELSDELDRLGCPLNP